MMLLQCFFFFFFFFFFFIRSYVVDTHLNCTGKSIGIGCNLKTMELLDCGLIGVCAVIRSYIYRVRESLHGTKQSCVSETVSAVSGLRVRFGARKKKVPVYLSPCNSCAG